MRSVLAAIVATVIALAPALAEQAPLAESAPPPPYEDQLLRLSEILGALHYLRPLCKSDEGNAWRDQMEALIETEQPVDLRRATMVDRFNHGYDSFKSVDLTCTPAAALATERYLQEGAKIAADITARYGK
jgi:uncharacterized protein (TIGR02301 family)